VNCHQTLPWVVSLQKKYPSLQIIGIHTPEFSWEKDRGRMREEMKKFGMNYPQVLDDKYDYWNALENLYWPSFYVVDKQGTIRGRFFGETHINDNQAKKIEALIVALEAEPQK
jgi:hypothetical protein